AVGLAGGEGFVLELNDAAGSVEPVRRDLPVVKADQVAYMSWSRDGKFLVGVQIPSGLTDKAMPVLWDVERERDITPKWLKEFYTAVFSPGTDELLTVSPNGQIAIWDTKSLGADPHPQPKLRFEEP